MIVSRWTFGRRDSVYSLSVVRMCGAPLPLHYSLTVLVFRGAEGSLLGYDG